MSIGGIIAGALGGGAQAVGQIADTQIKQNAWKEQAGIEQQLAIERDEAIQRRRLELNRQDTLERTTGPIADAELSLRKRQGAIDTDVAVDREGKVGKVRGDVERGNAAAYATPEGKAALKGIQAKADASESGSIKGSRAVAAEGGRLDNEEKREDLSLRKRAEEMRARGDEDGAQKLEDQRARLRGRGGSGAKTGAEPKSMADAVAAARELNKMADDAEMSGQDEQAKQLRAQAQSVLGNVTEKRGVAAPKKDAAPAGGPKEGETGTSKSGKPIVYQNGQWVYR